MILPIIFLTYLIKSFNNQNLIFFGLFLLGFYFLIYFIIKKSRKIIKDKKNNTFYEVKYTISSFLIFSLIVNLYFYLFYKGLIKFDFDFSILSVIYLIIFVILHDAYFYLIHSFLHTKFGMKYIHFVHHKSNPSNIWSSYSFHPIEAILYAGVSIIIFIFNVNFYALMFAIFYNDFFTILGHCGYELFGKKIKNSLFYKYFSTTTYHDVHHSHNNGNIGLYFTYLDKIFKTESNNYEKIFDKINK